MDLEIGEVTEPNKRKSQRTSTVLKSTAMVNKMLKDAKEKVSSGLTDYCAIRGLLEISPKQ